MAVAMVIEASAKAALTAMQALDRRGVHVIGVASSPSVTGMWSRACHERQVAPSPRDDPSGFQDWLLRFLGERRVDVLFPVGHYGALAVSEIQDAVRQTTRLILPPHEVFLRGYAKIGTLKAGMAAGVAIPDTWFPHEEGLEACLARIARWPILIKPTVGVGARGIRWCTSADEVRQQYESMEAEFGTCFLQDFVPSGGKQHKADLLLDLDGEMLAGVVYAKERMYPPDGGSSVLNVSTHRPDIRDAAYAVLRELGWVGFCDFDFIDDPRDGRTLLMEINPRFPESLRAATCAGVDLPGMLFDLSVGRQVVPHLDYPAGRIMRFFPGDLLWALRVGPRRLAQTQPSWFHFGPEVHYQLLSRDDPWPLVAYLLENLAMMREGGFIAERLRPS